MKYDFTTVIDRRGKDSSAVDSLPMDGVEVSPEFSRIPMWVADMNFATVPSVSKAMMERMQHPIYGYFAPSDSYYQAIINWQKHRNGVQGLFPENIGYENGVLGGLVSTVNALCSRGDAILLHAPTYTGFTKVLKNNGYNIVHSALVLDENNIWRMDFEDMEQKIKQHHIHVAVFCSPHNPCGRVWEPWEIKAAMEVYQRNNVFVISDEIWSDLVLPGFQHTPTQSVSEDAKQRTVAFYSPSKTFNLAGLIGSYHIVYNPWIRDRIEKESSLSHYNKMNVLSMHALLGAYCEEGAEWVDELRQVLAENAEYACNFIQQHFPGVTFSKPQGTYMLFLDCSEWCKVHGVALDELLKRGLSVGVLWQDGRPFHGACSIRMNLALPHSQIQEAFDRLNRYVFSHSAL